MSVKLLVEDSLSLYKQRRYHSAFCLALIALEASAYKRFGVKGTPNYTESTKRRFLLFVNEETRTHRLQQVRHGVDLPQQPDLPPPPSLALSDNFSKYAEELNRWKLDFDKWTAEHEKAHSDYEAQFLDAGDDFRGPNQRYLGKPRLVTTTGILYQARCELVHEGKLSAIRITHFDDDATLSVAGADSIEFSSNWIRQVLGIVVGAAENRGIFAA